MHRSVQHIPACAADIGPEWLTAVLPDHVRAGGTVSDVHAEVIGEGVGLLGEVARLTLTYSAAGDGAVRTLISKVPTTHDSFRAMGHVFGFYRKEHGFYAHVAERMNVAIPAAYVNLADESTGSYLLLLEDLAPRRPGNQLAGCSAAEAEEIVRTAARLHAAWWEHPELESFAEWLPGQGDSYFDIVEQMYAGALPRFEAGFADWVSPDVLALAGVVRAHFTEASARGAFRRPHTLIHGDFRLDNMLFADRPDGVEVAVVDWQLPFRANPMWDVVYFVCGNLDPSTRRAHQDRLLRVYHDELGACGVTGYSFDECVEDFRACGLVLVSYMVNLAGDADLDELNDRGRELVETLCRRYGEALDDLGSAEFLAGLTAD